MNDGEKISEKKPDESKGLVSGTKNVIAGSLSWVHNTFDNLCDWKIFWWELFGTAIFAHGISASDGDDWFITMSLFAGILLVAPFSGGHLNPAVSFGFFIKNGIIPDSEGKTSWNIRDLLARSCA